MASAVLRTSASPSSVSIASSATCSSARGASTPLCGQEANILGDFSPLEKVEERSCEDRDPSGSQELSEVGERDRLAGDFPRRAQGTARRPVHGIVKRAGVADVHDNLFSREITRVSPALIIPKRLERHRRSPTPSTRPSARSPWSGPTFALPQQMQRRLPQG